MDWSKLLESGLGSLGGALINGSIGLLGNEIAHKQARSDLDYQWNKMYSPQAQVRNMAAAGINPASAFGNHAPVVSGAQMQFPQNPFGGIGTSSLTDIGNYIKSIADAKKSGADTDKALAETDAIKLQNDLQQEFGRKSWILDVAQKYQNVILAKKTNDIKEQEKAINEFKKATEKAVSESKGIEKQMLEKRFGNLDIQIDLENKLQSEKINTEKSHQGALAASANASIASARLANAQASTEDALRDLKKFAIDLGNHMQGLEYGFNLDTYQTRLEKFANEAGIVKWTAFLNEIEAKDREAYNAVQRLIMGKGTKEDGKTLWNFINSGRQLIPFK